MTLSAPKKITWLIALVLGILALIGYFDVVAALVPYDCLLALIAWAILIFATLLRDL